MNFCVLEKKPFGKIFNGVVKYKYILSDSNSPKYCALLWNKLNDKPILYDYEFDNDMMKHNWHLNGEYAVNLSRDFMHRYVIQLQNLPLDKDVVDHINGYQRDNRKKNLRTATHGENIANSRLRSDKKPPCAELQAIGIVNLPRYVRWDNSEQKFTIDKHPQLMKEVAEGTRKKPVMSGSKSANITVLEKYQDIMARLTALNELIYSQEREAFKQLKQENAEEYEAICRCILEYEGKPVEVREAPVAPVIEEERRTAPGRKSVSKLPPDCGVLDTDIPKYCYYKPKSEGRGDKFVIDKHPVLVAEGKRQWSTPERTSLTTKAKFDILIEKLKELEESSSTNN